MKIKVFHNNNADINSYILIKNDKAMCIDPGFNGNDIYHFFIENSIDLEKVVLTHGHYDHIRDISLLYSHFKFKLHLHSRDMELLGDSRLNYANAFGNDFHLPSDIEPELVHDGNDIVFQDEAFKIISTPGHTAGSICIKYQNNVFTGDTLFYDSVGRTDLYSGNHAELKKSIKKLLGMISNGATIYPGHGKAAKLKDILAVNKYLSTFR